MIAPAASPTARPAGTQSQNCVRNPRTTPMIAPTTRPTMICLRLACGLGFEGCFLLTPPAYLPPSFSPPRTHSLLSRHPAAPNCSSARRE